MSRPTSSSARPPRRAHAVLAHAVLARAVLAAALAATLPAAAASVTDAAGLSVEVGDTSRIVSIGGTVTEILYDLGLADRIVAVDTTSLFPPEALGEKQSVGYMRALSAEGVLAADPSLVLAIDGAGPPAAVEVLQGSGVPYVTVDDSPSRDGVTARVRFIAGLMGVEEKGEALAAGIEAGFAKLDAARAGATSAPRVLFVLAFRDGHPMVGGSDTAADAVIALAGGTNVAADFTGYKPMSAEAILVAAPDVVVTMAHPGGSAPFETSPALAATPAGQANRLVEMDGLSLLGFGPRTPEVALALARAIGTVPAEAAGE